MGYLLHDPLVPGMAPMHTRVLAVGGDTARLDLMVANLRLRGYSQVKSSSDPAAAMAELRQQVLSFDLVMVDTHSRYPGGGGARELFEFAIREPQLCVYAVHEKGQPLGPLEMNDLNIARKPNYSFASNGHKSPQDNPDGLYNTSPSTTTSTITTSPSFGRRARRNNRKHVHDIGTGEVEQDGEHVEKEQQQPAQQPKKARFIWTDELHKIFVKAYDQLGDAAVPNEILKLMKDSPLTRELTREIIASHLQKHRTNLKREACVNRLRRSHSRTEHHRSTPQVSFPSPNMSSQQQAPPITQPDLSATVYINCGKNSHTMLQASTRSDMQDSHPVIHVQTLKATDKSNESVPVDVPLKDMYPGADEPKQNTCVGNSDGNGLHEDFTTEILNKEPTPPWEAQFLSSMD